MISVILLSNKQTTINMIYLYWLQKTKKSNDIIKNITLRD